MDRLYLSRWNLERLLAVLNTGQGQAQLVKNDTSHPKYRTTRPFLVTVIEDQEYYGANHPSVDFNEARKEPEPTCPTLKTGSSLISRPTRKSSPEL